MNRLPFLRHEKWEAVHCPTGFEVIRRGSSTCKREHLSITIGNRRTQGNDHRIWPHHHRPGSEFDYSGTQVCKALCGLGYEIVLVNSNPATIMTDPGTADRTYIEPLNAERLTAIIEKERPDAILPKGEVVVAGMAEYEPGDVRLRDVFHRADQRMYERKALLKQLQGANRGPR